MTGQTTIRLYPLVAEHYVPMRLKPDLGTPRGRGARCADEVFEQLTRRGFPPPPLG